LPPDFRDELELRGMLHVEEVTLPATIAQHAGVYGRRTLRAAGLCVLRKRLADLCEARICLGGKLEKFEGFWSGIFEEALFSASNVGDGKVLLCGMLGGAAAKVLQAARSGNWGELQEVNPDPELRKGYEQLKTLDPTIFPNISRVPELLSRKRLQERSGLSDEDFDRLADATDIEVVAALAIKALSRRAHDPGP
jgi:SLOG cluster2